MKKTYSEKLKDPRWQKKRLQILERDNWTCVRCRDADRTLHVHHISYQYGNEPWDYEDNNFLTLCDTCHATEGETVKDLNEDIKHLLSNGIDPLHIRMVLDLIYSYDDKGVKLNISISELNNLRNE